MSDNTLPGSPFSPFFTGGLSQAINPWSWWTSSMNQTGFININQVQSSNPELERRIVQDVAGYGKQLGRISEALEVLCAGVDETRLGTDERKALQQFRTMAAEIAAVKAGHYAPTQDNVERMIDGIRSLKKQNPQRYAEIVAELKVGLLDGDAGGQPTARS